MAAHCTSYGTPPAWTKTRLINLTIDFVYKQLSLWRNDSMSLPSAEERLNEHLCRFLDNAARTENCPFMFHNEQYQAGQRKIDFAIYPVKSLLFVSPYSSIHTAITVIEAKRLPTPGSGREREYVTGEGGKVTGGIQRFKLGEHGAEHHEAAIVGYIQEHDAHFFHSLINGWIKELAEDSPGVWEESETLERLVENPELRTSRTKSVHCRSGGLSVIDIHHLWVNIRNQ